MAKEPKAEKPAKAGKSGGKGGGATLLLAGLAAGVMLSYALPTAILLGFGLVPAMVAYGFDRSPGRPAARSVACLNLAGLAPALEVLWRQGATMGNAQSLLLSLETLPLAWAGGLVGWALAECLPWFGQFVVESKAARRRAALAVRRTELAEEWGERG